MCVCVLCVCVCVRVSARAHARTWGLGGGVIGTTTRWLTVGVHTAQLLVQILCCRVLQSVAECCRVLQGVCVRTYSSITGANSVLQSLAGCCRALQCAAVFLWGDVQLNCWYQFCVAGCSRVLQGVAGCYRVLQNVAECCRVSVGEYMAQSLVQVLCCSVCWSVLQSVAVCCSLLQCVAVCVAVCCRMLRSVAMCCIMLQCVFGRTYGPIAGTNSVVQYVAECCNNIKQPQNWLLRHGTTVSYFWKVSSMSVWHS